MKDPVSIGALWHDWPSSSPARARSALGIPTIISIDEDHVASEHKTTSKCEDSMTGSRTSSAAEMTTQQTEVKAL